MSTRNISLSILLAGILVLLPTAVFAGQTLTGKVEWRGEVQLKEPVTVATGAVLTVHAGTVVRAVNPQAQLTVQGEIQVLGTPDQPVRFEGPGWSGIQLVEPQRESIFRNAQFRDVETAISSLAAKFKVLDSSFDNCQHGVRLLRESAPLIEGNRFSGGAIGIEIEMRSFPVVRNNSFERLAKVAMFASHNSGGKLEGNRFTRCEVGIHFNQPFPETISNNRFSDNKLAIYCNQTKDTPTIERNRFENNEIAVVGFSFAYPTVRHNRFTGNQTALRNDQYGSMRVEYNEFTGNGTAVFNNRKSNPKIFNNNFEGNELVLFCDYSSYPQVKRNNLIGNQVVAKLGIFQSADWEKRNGSKKLMLAESQARQTRNSMLPQAPTEFTDRVDLSGNFWGDRNGAIAAAAADANLDLFWDRRDQPTVVYEGFGPEAYALDLVVFQPPLEKRVTDAGPQAP